MRPLVTAFVLGALAAGFVLVVGALAAGVIADAAGSASFRIALGPVLLLEFERRAGSAGTTLGSGVALVAVASGLGNAAAAAVLRRHLG